MKGKTANVFVYILLGMLILGLAGFGIGNFGGGITSMGRVGETEIDVNDYARALQQRLRSASQQAGRTVSVAEARETGLDRQVLVQVVASAALDEEARKRGISVGDARVAQAIRDMPAFQGLSGGFDRQAYEFTLDQNGLNPEGFERDVREGAARDLLQGAVIGGVAAPATFADTLIGFLAERRSFVWTPITASALAAAPADPGTETLRAFYDANPDQFEAPETRAITYVLLSPEMMRAEITLPEETLRRAYEDRIDEYVQPERRIVYRLVMPTQEAADQAMADLASGATSFDDLLAARGLDLEDIGLGEVARDDLPAAAADAVFGLEDTGDVGPIATDLGPAIYRVAAILNPREVPFEDVRDELFDELALDEARRAVADEIEPLNDLVASGATLEEIAAETPAVLDTAEITPDLAEGIAAYPAFREAVQAQDVGDFPELIELDDGGVAALRVDEIRPPQVPPFEEIEADVRDAWIADATQKAVQAQAETVKALLDGGTRPASLGLSLQSEELTRDAFIAGVPQFFLPSVFEMQADGVWQIIEGPEASYLVRLDAILPPDETDPDVDFLTGLLQREADQGFAQDIFDAYATAVQAEAGLQLDQAAVNAVLSQLQ
jgi:peptidyl-prolyl cis-trans isomerase D